MPTTWENFEKPGTALGGWEYNELNMTYNQILDTDTGLTVYYNGLGTTTTWSNQSPKQTTTYTNPSKVSSSWTNQVKI